MLKYNIWLVLVVVTLSAHLSTFAQQTLNKTILHDGIQRDYILYIPANYTGNEAVPLVFNFHGYGSNATEQMWYGDFRSIADTAGFLLVHPQGTLFNGITHWNVGGWTAGSTADDVGFINALIDSMAVAYNIAATRIYATGMSNGGFMSFLLACQLSEKIAAIASVAGSMTPETYNNSNPMHPTPIIQFHGTADDMVPYNGEIWSKPIADVLDYWVGYNHCNPIPSITALPDIDPNDGSTVEHVIYNDGDNSVNVEHFMIIDGGHTWPGNIFGSEGTNNDIDASLEIWRFFSKYDINGLVGTTGVETAGKISELTVYPNPAKSFVYIKNDITEPTEFEIISIAGKKMLHGFIDSTKRRIDISGLPPNIYMLKIGNRSVRILKIK